jgi:Zn-dependent peptidase ImmA (M78 family)
MHWKMPIGPVRSLVRWLESAGCIVIEEDFETTRVSGLSQWIEDIPIILINSRIPTCRKRLTLAHELGHLCLHSDFVSQDLESEANSFAAEFLMPTELIRFQLKNLTIAKLVDLKREWGVSMAALIERAYDLEQINVRQRTNLYKSLSARGWRIQEPGSEEIPPEYPQLPNAIGNAMQQRGLTMDEISAIAGFAPDMMHPFRPTPRPESRGLRVVRLMELHTWNRTAERIHLVCRPRLSRRRIFQSVSWTPLCAPP